jgi:hypothetical protein
MVLSLKGGREAVLWLRNFVICKRVPNAGPRGYPVYSQTIDLKTENKDVTLMTIEMS